MDIILLILVVLVILFPFVRFMIVNWYKVLYSVVCNTYDYIRYKRYNECREYGKIHAYTGLFGQGKTKECVRHIVGLYKRYNNRKIWNDDTKEWITQRVVVHSNVALNIPYENFNNVKQLINCQGSGRDTVHLFLIDEASVVFNSRQFKENFSTPVLNTILTCRHHRIGIYLTAQRFSHLDALLRQTISNVYDCKYSPFTHIQRIRLYDAWELEYCSSLALVKQISTEYTWTSDKVYAMYDTYAMVEDVVKNVENNAYISDREVLESQGQSAGTALNMVSKLSRQGRKRMK